MPYLQYQDVSNLRGWAMSQKLPVNNFECIKDTSQFNEYFIKSHNEANDEKYFFDVDVQYPKKLDDLHIDLPFLPERMKIKQVRKLAANLHNKTEYLIHIRTLKQSLYLRLILKCNRNTCLKPYVNMNTGLRKKAKTDFEKKLFSCSVFWKNYGNVRKYRDTKPVTTE